MIQIAFRREFSDFFAYSATSPDKLGGANQGWQDKSADHGRAHVVDWVECLAHLSHRAFWRLPHKSLRFQSSKRHRMRLNVISSA
jgi:hypothetical protein